MELGSGLSTVWGKQVSTDLLLAIVHHLLIFALASLLVAELVLVFRGLGAGGLTLISRLDMGFGASAALILIVGFLRVFLGVKPESYYFENPFFWAKIAAFALVGVLSIMPTLRYFRWARLGRDDPAYEAPTAQLGAVKAFLVAEAVVFVSIPIFAAIMARG